MDRERLELIDPILPPIDAVMADVRRVLEAKRFTNHGPFVAALESEAATVLGAAHAVAVSSGTLGLMAAFTALGWSGEVVVPAFTFPATAHAIRWAGLEPVFADVDRATFTLDPVSVARVVGPRTAGIVPVTSFGVPPDLDALADAAPGVPIVLDDAHGFGSRRASVTRPCASVVSLHATKTVLAGEGGLVLTDDDGLAQRLRRIANFGFVPGGDCREVGLNAKMPELSAVLARHWLPLVDETIVARRVWADRYRRALVDTPGLGFQVVPDDVEWNAQAFAMVVDEAGFGLSRDALRDALDAHGITTRRYFHPPLHQLACYRGQVRADALPTTEELSSRTLCLPLLAATPADVGDEIARRIRSLIRRPRVCPEPL